MSVEERFASIEARLAALEKAVKVPQEGDIKRTPFGDLIYRGGRWENLPREDTRVPAIPHNEDNPPLVADARVKVLAWIEDETGFGEWYGFWQAANATSVARIEPWSDKDRENMARCGKAPEEGTYTYHSLRAFPAKWTVLKKVRNPWLPIPSGCRLAADGFSLEDDV